VEDKSQSKSHVVRVTVEAGICGFPCVIEAQKKSQHRVSVKITGSECKQIQGLSKLVNEISMRELFAPISRNPVFSSAQRSGCHPSCAIPVAVLKAVEVAMDMALPRDVVIKFE